MATMTQEEKAKAYDEAIELVRKLLKTIGNATLGNLVLKNEFERMFPELKESEDERIRGAIIDHLKDNNLTEWAAWLEKQGEQKPIDKVEQKFKAGDIIINKENGAISKVNKILPYDYELISFGTGKHLILDQTLINGNSKLWTIQDANDGDVLVGGEQLFLFKRMNTSNSFYAHCNYHFIGYSSLSVFHCSYSINNIYPATKEQRDLLFQKMKEGGYEWDAEKKELKKIEQKPWSEEDENYYRMMVISIQWARAYNRITDDSCDNQLTWFKSLKDRVQPQPRQEWSEDDEEMINNIIDYMKPIPIFFESTKGKSGKEYTKEFVKNSINWLKSLKDRVQPQSQWKPSDEQMGVIEAVINNRSFQRRHLDSLYEQLKKLREE